METQSQTKRPLKEALFERIETEHVSPRPRLFFQGRECLVWSLWFLSVLVGALAIAVSMFVVTHWQYELYEATHEKFFTFMVEVLPYLWIIIFGLMVYVAVYNIQHTKHGYRYPVWMILASSIVLSFAGGSALQFFGLGYTIDNVLGRQMSAYVSRDKLEERLWQVPEEGRLMGKQVFSTVSPTTTVVFEDSSGQRWSMDVSELQERDIELLASEQKVRLLGEAKNIQLHHFHACGVFPLMIEKKVTMDEMFAERKVFVERIRRHIRQPDDQGRIQGMGTFASASLPEKSVCANIAVVHRVQTGR